MSAQSSSAAVQVAAKPVAPTVAASPSLVSVPSDAYVHVIESGESLYTIARRYDVMSFPTLLLFRDGEVVRRMIGARGKHHLLEELADWV